MSAQAADLIETNFVEFLLSMGRAGGAVETARRRDRVDDRGFADRVPQRGCPMHRLRRAERVLVEEWRDALRQRSAGLVALDPGMHPHDLRVSFWTRASRTGAMNLRWPHSSPPWLTCPWPPSCRSRLSRTPLPSTSTARFSPLGSVRAQGGRLGRQRLRHHWTRTTQSMAPLRRHGGGRSCRHRLHPADRLDRRHLLRLHAARRPATWLWCRDHLRSDAPRGAHRSHVRRPRLLADGAARLRAARIPNHLLHPALRAGRVARAPGTPTLTWGSGTTRTATSGIAGLDD